LVRRGGCHQVDKLLHGEEPYACARATPVSKRVPITQAARLSGRFPACRSTYKSLGKRSLLGRVSSQIEKAKAQTRAKIEHPFRVIKCQFSRTIID
jgi:IS5 family transposase